MTRVLYRISRSACPAADRPWLDALFAESDAVESGRARLVWLLGAWGMLMDRQAQRLDLRLIIGTAACLALSLVSGAFWFTGYEGLALDDDLYMAGSGIFIAALLGLSAAQLRRPYPDGWL
jgi:hypothetical protein